MTYQKAIKILKYTPVTLNRNENTTTREYNKMLNIAEKAIEKQIPKKSMAHGKYNFVCPLCKQELGIDREDISIYDITPPKHCSQCGQALDWSDTE